VQANVAAARLRTAPTPGAVAPRGLSFPRVNAVRKWSIAVVLVVIACGGTTVDRPGHTTSGAGGGGAGGSPVGSGGQSLGHVAVEFTTEKQTFCFKAQCGNTPTVEIRDSSGKSLQLYTSCFDLQCNDCNAGQCVAGACLEQTLTFTTASLDWDGTYYDLGLCPSGASCVRPALAKAGTYSAHLCATAGNPVMGDPQGTCVPAGAEICKDVPFDYPTTSHVSGKF
jgi:hypothetical protein